MGLYEFIHVVVLDLYVSLLAFFRHIRSGNNLITKRDNDKRLHLPLIRCI